MPWKVSPVSEVRLALCHCVRTLRVSVSEAARRFGVSRRTAHKWLAVYDAAPAAGAAPLAALRDRPRRPRCSPRRTPGETERAVLAVRDRFNWGPRKIYHYLLQEARRRGEPPPDLPSVRTLASVLRRNGRVPAPAAPAPDPAPLRFERGAPNELWQVDFKGPVEVGRRRLMPLSVEDDHSRYLLAFEPCGDVTMASAWAVLWEVFAGAGLPEGVLCDNAFGTMGTARPAGVSWFDSRLIRLGVRPTHGRPYHPQTQGKVERLHGSAGRELFAFNARRDREGHFRDDCRDWRHVYNTLRPHEALGDEPPASRWAPSPRRRPDHLPEPESFYPAGCGNDLRTVDGSGQISFGGCRILCGRGIAGQRVRVERRDGEVAVFYCWKQFRRLSHDQLLKGKIL
jgi:transposase-like protein